MMLEHTLASNRISFRAENFQIGEVAELFEKLSRKRMKYQQNTNRMYDRRYRHMRALQVQAETNKRHPSFFATPYAGRFR